MINKNSAPLKIISNKEKRKKQLILTLSCCIFVFVNFIQIFLSATIKHWQGVMAQILVIISVFIVVKVIKYGYITALILNLISALLALVKVIASHDFSILPGIVIPLCTIVTISIIAYYVNKQEADANNLLEERSKRFKEITELQEVSIMAMASLAETRDSDTGKHIQRTKLYVKILSEFLYKSSKYSTLIDQNMINSIVSSAPLHDIGKVGIPDSILLKPGKLTSEEFETMKYHTTLGYRAILKADELIGKDDSFLKYGGEIILYHHERWDGSGYLSHLKGEEIPLSARIMSVADVYDALTSKRVYKDIHSHQEAMNIISSESGKQFDPEVVTAFIACQKLFRNISQQYRDS